VAFPDLVVKQGLNFEILSFQPTLITNRLPNFKLFGIVDEWQNILSGQLNICIGQPFF
jgi:hypothetical protein